MRFIAKKYIRISVKEFPLFFFFCFVFTPPFAVISTSAEQFLTHPKTIYYARFLDVRPSPSDDISSGLLIVFFFFFCILNVLCYTVAVTYHLCGVYNIIIIYRYDRIDIYDVWLGRYFFLFVCFTCRRLVEPWIDPWIKKKKKIVLTIRVVFT